MAKQQDSTIHKARRTLDPVVQQRAALYPTTRPSAPTSKVLSSDISNIVSHRLQKHDDSWNEEYLVEWKIKGPTRSSPLSWHSVDELRACLKKLQKYIYNLPSTTLSSDPGPVSKNDLGLNRGIKRKTPDFILEQDKYQLGSPREKQAQTNGNTFKEQQVYRGSLTNDNGVIKVNWSSPAKPNLDNKHVPWEAIKSRALQVGNRLPQGRARVKLEFEKRLADLNALRGPARLSFSNTIDDSVPSLNFKFINQHRLGKDVFALDPETIVGCGSRYEWSNQHCSPHMGQHIGCEYIRVCDCMEYAQVDEKRLTAAEKEWVEANPGETRLNLPKKFPYYTSGVKEGCLVSFYLKNRYPIYECNAKCECGPDCRNKLVQHGCKVPLDMFKTADGRGWGLRCGRDLQAGEFIDTYRGEVITSGEADKREKHNKSASYLFTLDKFAGDDSDMAAEECYVVDGEYVGGPTRFINHSCDPNCQQHTVSLNKFDRKVYLLAFFASKDIPKGTELTFDYMDKDGEMEDVEEGEDKSKLKPCLCGSEKCRGYLWT